MPKYGGCNFIYVDFFVNLGPHSEDNIRNIKKDITIGKVSLSEGGTYLIRTTMNNLQVIGKPEPDNCQVSSSKSKIYMLTPVILKCKSSKHVLLSDWN